MAYFVTLCSEFNWTDSLKFSILVGAKGFEPSAPAPKAGALPRLRYAPTLLLGGAGGFEPRPFPCRNALPLRYSPSAISIVSVTLVACQVSYHVIWYFSRWNYESGVKEIAGGCA